MFLPRCPARLLSQGALVWLWLSGCLCAFGTDWTEIMLGRGVPRPGKTEVRGCTRGHISHACACYVYIHVVAATRSKMIPCPLNGTRTPLNAREPCWDTVVVPEASTGLLTGNALCLIDVRPYVRDNRLLTFLVVLNKHNRPYLDPN